MDGKSSKEYMQLMLELLTAQFVHLLFYTLITFMMILSVMLLSVLMIVLSILIVIRHLICGNN